jgi:L-histidine N-alpha-methyltransferase
MKSAFADVRIHQSQFPERVDADLMLSLRTRQINHKFHYDSYKQTRKWLLLHQAHSPSRTDPHFAATYDAAFAAAAECIADSIHVIGLGCGGGQKDARLLKLLGVEGRFATYLAVDVSTAMVLVGQAAAGAVLGAGNCRGLVCDLARADDLAEFLDREIPQNMPRLVTFFGMIPNFEPDRILPRLASVLRSGDFLLFSANLAPGADYPSGVRRILPQYDNPLTREWLLTLLLDLGFERSDGELQFAIAEFPPESGLLRVEGTFSMRRPVSLEVHGERFVFRPGDSIRLFFSYRYTPGLLRNLLASFGLAELGCWLTESGEEGVFLLQKRRQSAPHLETETSL